MANLIFVLLLAIPVFVGIGVYLAYWYMYLDRDMMKAFRKVLIHQYYDPFSYSGRAIDKQQYIHDLEDSIAKAHELHGVHWREYTLVGFEILVEMKYEMKLRQCSIAAQRIVDKMKK